MKTKNDAWRIYADASIGDIDLESINPVDDIGADLEPVEGMEFDEEPEEEMEAPVQHGGEEIGGKRPLSVNIDHKGRGFDDKGVFHKGKLVVSINEDEMEIESLDDAKLVRDWVKSELGMLRDKGQLSDSDFFNRTFHNDGASCSPDFFFDRLNKSMKKHDIVQPKRKESFLEVPLGTGKINKKLNPEDRVIEERVVKPVKDYSDWEDYNPEDDEQGMLSNMEAVANALDDQGFGKFASIIDGIMRKVAGL